MEVIEPPFRLKELKIEISYRCSLKCIHCSSNASVLSQIGMQQSDCSRIITDAIKMGVEEVAFSGGEPFLWEPLYDSVKLAIQGGLKTTIYSSGNVPEISTVIRRIGDLGVSRCVFSLFGASGEVHEKITRVPGSFEKTMNAIDYSVASGLRTELHFVPVATNYTEILGVAKLGRKIGVHRVSALRFVPQGRGSEMRDQILSESQNLWLRSTILDLRRRGFDIRTGSPYNFLMLNEKSECCSAIDRMTIGPDLRIYPCDAFKQIKAELIVGTLEYSSLRNAGLQECWLKSPFLNAVRSYLITDFSEPCVSCAFLEKCLSGCLAQKVLVHSNLDKRADPSCLKRKSFCFDGIPFGS